MVTFLIDHALSWAFSSTRLAVNRSGVVVVKTNMNDNLKDIHKLDAIQVLASTMARQFEISWMQSMSGGDEQLRIHAFNIAVTNLQELNRKVFGTEFDFIAQPVSDVAAIQSQFNKEME